MTTPTTANPRTNQFLPPNLEQAAPDAGAAAREQANEYESLFGDTEMPLPKGGTISVPPHPDYGLLTDDRMAAWEQLQFEVDTEYEREEDIFIPEQRMLDSKGNETGVVMPEMTQSGALKRPYRRKNAEGKSVLVTPPHTVNVVQVALGQEQYDRLIAGGASSKNVWKVWGEQSMRIQERNKRDSKIAAGTVDLAAVPRTDSE